MRATYNPDDNTILITGITARDNLMLDRLLTVGMFLLQGPSLEWHNEVWAPMMQEALDSVPPDKRMALADEKAETATMANLGSLFGVELQAPPGHEGIL